MQAMHEVARQCDAEGLFGTAGGHAVGGRLGGVRPRRARPAAAAVAAGAHDPAQRLLRHARFGFYERFLREVLARSGTRVAASAADSSRRWKSGREVQSRPEPGLAILAFGKRDASFDLDLPMPFARVRAGVRTPLDADLAHRQAQRPACLSANSGRCRCRASAISSAAGSRIPARRSTNGAGCRSSTTTTASPARSARSSSLRARPDSISSSPPPVPPPSCSCSGGSAAVAGGEWAPAASSGACAASVGGATYGPGSTHGARGYRGRSRPSARP